MSRSHAGKTRRINEMAGPKADARLVKIPHSGETRLIIKCKICLLPNPDGGTAIRPKFNTVEAWWAHELEHHHTISGR